ncbi:MAG: signal peptidase I [Clostridia bacterium]|nr:signal peptidase I [Clostridia bacterium]
MLKAIKTIWGVLRTILTIILVGLLVIVVTQRVSNNKMAVAGFRIFTVVTESMKPEYEVGDAIFTKTIEPSEIKIGDDITYLGMAESFKDKIVTHRVINIEKAEDGTFIFETKGIANPKEDPKINETQVFGKVIYKIKSISYINGIIGNLYGMYFAIFIPFGLIMFIEYILYKRDKDEDEDIEDDKQTDDNNENNQIDIDEEKEKRKERRRKRRNRKRKNSVN